MVKDALLKEPLPLNYNEKKVLLVGNGIHRAFHGEGESWESLLKYIVQELGAELCISDFPECSPLLKYEFIHSEYKRNNPKKKFIDCVGVIIRKYFESASFNEHVDEVNSMIWNCFNTVLTTNVDNRFELTNEKNKKWISKSAKRWKYSLYRQKILECGNSEKKIFYMHGEVSKPKSLCFDLAHYLGEYRNHFEDKLKKSAVKQLETDAYDGMRELSSRDLSKNSPTIKSWTHMFFEKDVDVIGQGLSDNELDLWWVIKLRRLKECKNKVRYIYPSMESESERKRLALFRSFNIEPLQIQCVDQDYKKFYQIYFEKYARE